jgi:hypothetical protein
MKIPQLIALCLVFSGAAIGQCSLTLKDAPAIRGLRLGMTPDQVTALFGKPFRQNDDYIGYVSAVPQLVDLELKILRPNNFEGKRQRLVIRCLFSC